MSNWQTVYDEAAKANYYWNPKTNETTWDEPLEIKALRQKPATSKEATETTTEPTEEQKKAMEDYYNSKEYYDWYMENMTKAAQLQATSQIAYKKADTFTDLEANPIPDSSVHMDKDRKAFNQMNVFFDVDQYQRERALDREKGKIKKKLSAKEIQKFKKLKVEKKRLSLIERMGVDQ
jgi:hypothetical protein